LEGTRHRDVGSLAEGEQSREQDGKRLRSNPVIKPEASELTIAKVNFGASSKLWQQLTERSPDGSVKVMSFPKISASTLTIHPVKPFLPVGGRRLQELVQEFGQQSFVLNIQAFDSNTSLSFIPTDHVPSCFTLPACAGTITSPDEGTPLRINGLHSSFMQQG